MEQKDFNLLELDDKMPVHHTHDEDTDEEFPEDRAMTALADIIVGVQQTEKSNHIKFELEDEDLSSPQKPREDRNLIDHGPNADRQA